MTFSFPEMEKEVLAAWKAGDIFNKTLEKTKPLNLTSYNTFTFYDGPPFATGLPHHGHLLASTIKDIIPRFQTMKGKYVARRWGWDCHGLPIEHEIDKALGMSAQEAVKKLGVKGYNDKCREIVERYTSEWKETIERVGRWVDFDDNYKTMDASYMESVWWVFRELWNKDLVYSGTKVMPYSTALQTPLSNFEASSNHQNVQDPAVVVLFEEYYDDLDDPPKTRTYYAAWTTTPWTLPANLALCVNPSLIYVKVHLAALNADIVIAKDCIKNFDIFKDAPIIEEFEGDAMIGNLYLPLYPFSADFDKENAAFVVLGDDYVKTDTGTGMVHLAPAFGVDDSRVVAEAGIDSVCPIDDAGRFTDQVPPYAGMYIKDADPKIIKDLKAQNKILVHSTVKHSYPFCPRSDTPLIYKSVPAWYVAVEKIKDKLISENKKTTWVPSHLRDGRFGKWLENAQDWCVSRNRVWGTPLPIWVNDVTNDSVCVGSLRDLREVSGLELPEGYDLHRENVDDITFSREGEEGVYRRVPEVFDCWFESGAMPYAQIHHPFAGSALSYSHPADFIAEGVDQTRGWFYTLMVISVALSGKPAFKNVIVNGIVLAADGKKMSKRLKNYTDPMELLEKYGADAFRLYLIDSGLVRGEPLAFEDKGIAKITRRVLLPLHNAYTFLDMYAKLDDWKFTNRATSTNVLDRWILSRLNSLTMKVVNSLNSYKIGEALPEIFKFLDDLTNWYIRLNRRRFYAPEMTSDKEYAFCTLWKVLITLVKVLAPFIPFLTDHLYKGLTKYGSLFSDGGVKESVHLASFPDFSFHSGYPLLETAVEVMQEIIVMGRKQRDEKGVKIKTPLSELMIVAKNTLVQEIKDKLENYLKTELNVKQITYKYVEAEHVEYHARANFSTLGKRLGDRMQDFKVMIECLDNEDLTKLEAGTPILLDGEILDKKEIIIHRRPLPDSGVLCNNRVAVGLNFEISDELIEEGVAREIVNRIQKARKDAGLEVSDRITVVYNCKQGACVKSALGKHAKYIMQETLSSSLSYRPEVDSKSLDETEIGGEKLFFKVEKFIPVSERIGETT